MGKTFSRISGLFITRSKEQEVHERDKSPGNYQYQSLTTGTAHQLASPRSPLQRSKRPLSSSTAPSDEPLAKRIKRNFQYLEFAFLQDDFTINFVENSKVMFIMKGLPGSGKSCISKEIKKVYEDAVICSVDQYFIQQGIYKVEREKLRDAHKYCQQQAFNAAEQNSHVIVIDVNSSHNSEIKFYLKLARTHKYIPVVVEPQTPWATILTELAVKHYKHYPGKGIVDKMKSYEPVLPVYYGWFLNDMDSHKISSIGLSWLQQAVGVEGFMQEDLEAYQLSSCEDLFGSYRWNYNLDDGTILHATSKFTARGEREGAREYITNPLVRQSVGKCFRLCIVGFVITTRTIGARLKLTEEQLELWSKNDNEDPPVAVPNFAKTGNSHLKEVNSEEVNSKSVSVCVPTVATRERLDTKKFHPTSGKGSSAHITLACAPNIRPVTTGFDLIQAVRAEKKALNCDSVKPVAYTIGGGSLVNYGNGIWVVYPDHEVLVSSLFSAFY